MVMFYFHSILVADFLSTEPFPTNVRFHSATHQEESLNYCLYCNGEADSHRVRGLFHSFERFVPRIVFRIAPNLALMSNQKLTASAIRRKGWVRMSLALGDLPPVEATWQ
jgi:hypothetical protein